MSLCTLRKFFLLRLLEINTFRKATPVTSITATIMNIRTPATAPAIEELSFVSPVVVGDDGVTIDEVIPEVKQFICERKCYTYNKINLVQLQCNSVRQEI